MPTYTFDIEKAFPEGDPVARFVTVLAMIINEWHRTMAMMPTSSGEDPETRGIRLMLARQEAAACFEAAKFIAESRRRIPRIETFVEGLGPDAQNELALVAAASDQGSPDYQEWLEQHRNVTSHYPKLDPNAYGAGTEEIANAMKRAADAGAVGTVTVGDTDKTLRFHFADEISVHLLPDIVENPILIKKLTEARLAIGRFAGLAFAAYRAEHAEASSSRELGHEHPTPPSPAATLLLGARYLRLTTLSPLDCLRCLGRWGALPEAQDRPADDPEGAVEFAVSLGVPRELRRPILAVVGRPPVADFRSNETVRSASEAGTPRPFSSSSASTSARPYSSGRVRLNRVRISRSRMSSWAGMRRGSARPMGLLLGASDTGSALLHHTTRRGPIPPRRPRLSEVGASPPDRSFAGRGGGVKQVHQ